VGYRNSRQWQYTEYFRQYVFGKPQFGYDVLGAVGRYYVLYRYYKRPNGFNSGAWRHFSGLDHYGFGADECGYGAFCDGGKCWGCFGWQR
jgi:hypothetical protein